MKNFYVYKESVKKLLTAAESNVEIAKRICGTVADIITVDGRYKMAIGAAVGASVQNIITPTVDDARYLIEYLKKNGGVATFMPLDTIIPKLDSEEIKRAVCENGAIGLAAELVQYASRYEQAVLNLLGNTLICDTIANATAIVKKFPNRFKTVTLDGDIISINGLITGGESQKRFGCYFEQEREKQTGTTCEVKQNLVERFS